MPLPRACPLPALLLLAGLVATASLYTWGAGAYFELREMMGLRPFPPFLDLHNVIAAVECWQQGIDVYRTNPCDMLGRPHLYSPLWLRIPALLGQPGWPGQPGWLGWLGIGINLGLILAVAALPCPAGWRPGVVMLLAVASPDTAFAMERANMDVLIFAVVTLGALLLAGGLAARSLAYALFLAMGLLKFYPLILLALVLREAPRIALPLLAAIAAATLLAVLPLAGEFLRALANIYPLPWFSGTFGAGQLPEGVAHRLGQVPLLAASIWLALVAGVLLTAWGMTRDTALVARLADLPDRHAHLLLVGALLICGCFVAGQSVEYRAIFLLLVLPALLRLAVGSRRFAAASGAVALLMWDPVLRRLTAYAFPPGDDTLSLPSFVLWLLREALWWWLVAVLLGLLAALLLRARRGRYSAPGLAASQSP